VKACRPRQMSVTGEFTPRGGIYTTITADYVRPRRKSR
jgi:NADPH-dependent 7-cyano-7-deazaguanine reductase QueF